MKPYRHKGILFSNGEYTVVDDALAVEASLNISINNIAFTVTMRTPGHDRELITGLLYSEEVYRDQSGFPETEIRQTNEAGYPIEINVKLEPEKILKDFEGSRNLVSASSCGLCGRTSFEDSLSQNSINDNSVIEPSLIFEMFEKMSAAQELFKSTGGTHAAAAFDLKGQMLSVMEDIGRHNAVDKVIGDLLIKNKIKVAKCMLVSGRVSYEIVNKALSAGIPFLASVSAASSMAVEDSQKAGITLMAFCRKNKLTVYTHSERLFMNDVVELKH